MRSRSSIQALFDAATTTARVDEVARALIAEGATSPFISDDWWKWVTITGSGHTLKILVAPDYFAFGANDDSFPLARCTPFMAQACADKFDAILPSRSLVRAIQAQANPKIPYLDVKGAPYHVPVSQIETPEATDDMAKMRDAAFDKYGVDPSAFGPSNVLGYRKCIVVQPNLDGSHVQIYGGRGGGGDPPWGMIQGTSNPPVHVSSYSDYSHGVILVSRKAELDGEPVDLRFDVFGSDDPKIVALVSDQGRFDPVFPNAGGSSAAKFSASSAAPPVGAPDRNLKSGGTAKAPASSAPSKGASTLKVLGAIAAAGLLARWVFG